MSYVAGSGISKWWASIKLLPPWGFCVKSLMTPTIGVLAGSMPVVPNVSWCRKTDTAYADRQKKLIVIGDRLFSERASERINPTASKQHAIETCLGLVVHEGMHFIFSPDEISGLINEGLPLNKETALIANVVEDVFIEYEAPLVDKSYGWMISSLWEYYWPRATMQNNLNVAWDGVTSSDVEGILKTLVMWKNQDYDFVVRSEFERELFDILYSVRGMKNLQDRKDLIGRLICKIFSEEEIERQKADSADSENSCNEEGDGDKASKKAENIDILGKQFAKNGEAFQEEVFLSKSQLYSNFGVASGYPYSFVNVNESYSKFIINDYKKWSRLAEWQLDVGSVRQHRGTPGNYGRLTHPSRFFDDGKIFSKSQKSSPSGRVAEGGAPQTILLIDFSGSMFGSIFGSSQTKFDAAMHVAGGVGKSLSQAKHRVGVYGHTTSGFGSIEQCEIFSIKGFNDSVDVFLKRLTTISQKGAQYNNMDATAIEAVASKFKFDGSPCRMFVISDGAPHCNYYSGDSAINITRAQVDKLRSRGVEIFSMCIDPSAMECCDGIYGEKNNFNVTNPKVADEIIKKVLGRV